MLIRILIRAIVYGRKESGIVVYTPSTNVKMECVNRFDTSSPITPRYGSVSAHAATLFNVIFSHVLVRLITYMRNSGEMVLYASK